MWKNHYYTSMLFLNLNVVAKSPKLPFFPSSKTTWLITLKKCSGTFEQVTASRCSFQPGTRHKPNYVIVGFLILYISRISWQSCESRADDSFNCAERCIHAFPLLYLSVISCNLWKLSKNLFLENKPV